VRGAKNRVVVQFDYYAMIVILSAAVFQAERRISRLTGPVRKPNCAASGACQAPVAMRKLADLFQAQLAIVLPDNPVALAGGVFKFLAVHDLHCATGVLDNPLLLQNSSGQAHAGPIRP
jgi:hypothetical protein